MHTIPSVNSRGGTQESEQETQTEPQPALPERDAS